MGGNPLRHRAADSCPGWRVRSDDPNDHDKEHDDRDRQDERTHRDAEG